MQYPIYSNAVVQATITMRVRKKQISSFVPASPNTRSCSSCPTSLRCCSLIMLLSFPAIYSNMKHYILCHTAILFLENARLWFLPLVSVIQSADSCGHVPHPKWMHPNVIQWPTWWVSKLAVECVCISTPINSNSSHCRGHHAMKTTQVFLTELSTFVYWIWNRKFSRKQKMRLWGAKGSYYNISTDNFTEVMFKMHNSTNR